MSKQRLAKKNSDVAYGLLVNESMGASHPYGGELAILRKAIYALANGKPLPQEFADYYNEAERVKSETREYLS